MAYKQLAVTHTHMHTTITTTSLAVVALKRVNGCTNKLTESDISSQHPLYTSLKPWFHVQ